MSIRTMTAVWERSTLSGTELLLLLAVADHADDNGIAWPSVESLANKVRMSERACRYLLPKIAATGELVIERNAGPKGCNLFRVQVLQGCNSFRGAKTGKGGAKNGKGGAIAVAPESSTESSTESSIDKRARKAARFDPVDYLVSQGIDSQTVGDWLTLRKAKRAAVTKTAIAGIEREAVKAGLSLADALATCCERGWQGFRADWLADERRAAAPGYRSTAQLHADTIRAMTTLAPSRSAGAGRVIDAEVERLP